MSRLFSRLACAALLSGLVALGGTAEAANIGTNLNVRTSSNNMPQTVAVGGGRHSVYGSGQAAAPPSYGGQGYGHRRHVYDRNTQFNGIGDSSAKLPK